MGWQQRPDLPPPPPGGPSQAGPFNQAPYGGPPGGPRPTTNPMAVASMVLGLAGILLFVFFAVVSILAVVFGFVARKQIRRSGGWQTGKDAAITGIVLGFVEIGIFVLAAATGHFHFHVGSTGS